MNWLYATWPWYISGPMITLIMLSLLLMGKRFGMSSNLRTLCTICSAGKVADFFKFEWETQRWNLIVVIGVIFGGYIASNFLTHDSSVAIHPEVIKDLQTKGIMDAGQEYIPKLLFSNDAMSSPKTILLLTLAGFFVGFGSRYAGGCTSEHAISGLSNLQLPSLIAVVGFFIGGLLMTHFIFPLIF